MTEQLEKVNSSSMPFPPSFASLTFSNIFTTRRSSPTKRLRVGDSTNLQPPPGSNLQTPNSRRSRLQKGHVAIKETSRKYNAAVS